MALTAKKAFKCATCGKEFLQYESQIGKRTFCSSHCYNASKIGSVPHNKGKTDRIEKPCEQCGGLITGTRSELRLRKYCGRDCMASAFSGDVKTAISHFDIDQETGCWVWNRSTNRGYGRFRTSSGGSVYAHRVSYEFHIGPIPDGLCIDHICRNRACINPAHLEPVTNAENIRRGNAGKGPRSEAHRKAVSAAMNIRYQDPAQRAAQAERLAKTRGLESRKSAAKAATQRPEYRAAASERMRLIWAERKESRHVDSR